MTSVITLQKNGAITICWRPGLLTGVITFVRQELLRLSAKLAMNCSRSCTRSGPRISLEIVSDYDQKIPQTADKPMAPRGRAK